MATQSTKTINFLYLDEIILQDIPRLNYTLRLFVDDKKRKLQTEDNRTWTLVGQRAGVSPTTKMRVEIQMKNSNLPWAKTEHTSKVIDLENLFNDYWTSKEHEIVVLEVVDVGQHGCSFELRFSSNATAESLRASLSELEGLLEKYCPMMDGPTERVADTVIKYGVAFAELNPVAKVVFGLVRVTFELLKEQNKYDQMLSVLFDRLQRILPLADQVADQIVCKETPVLEIIIPRLFEVMQRVAKFSCNYVKRARMVGGLAYPETIEEMDRELTKVIEDFERAVNVEALHLAKETEKELLLGRLKYVEAGYHQNLRCMEGTRKSLLKEVEDWVANKSEQKSVLQGNIYWLYGLPGIGKTSFAHSICANLHEQEQLAGSFFCRRDDANLSEPRNILPSLINKLAGIFPPFRSVVASHLRNDPNLTPESMKESLFLEFIRSVPRYPQKTLVFVIDALDECGDDQSRPYILNVLNDAAAQAPWLKVIVTSRPEADIQRFFDSLAQPSHFRRDLAEDEEASADLRTFAKSQFDLVASKWYLPTPWPEESRINEVISRANGLFIFIKTLVLALKECEDPEESLKSALQGSVGSGLKSLYGLYSSILRGRKVPVNAEFKRMIGVLLATAPYRPLCEDTIGELAGVRVNLVKKWMDDLSSLLYRDKDANGGIRVRHLSISEFFIGDDCHSDYQVNLQDTNVQLSITCLKTMICQLRFNICKLEDSRLVNADVKDLPSRIKENISDPLQYSSLYWSNHLCFTPENFNGDRRVWESLKEFFEGLYILFWIEVLSIMGLVPIGAPSLRRVISWVKNADLVLLGRIQDVYRFVVTFHTPIITSAPHTYISTGPFLPSQSPLSTVFGSRFCKAIKMQTGKLVSWSTSPLERIGHTGLTTSVRYSPNGCHIVTGSMDKTVRIWDVETGAAVGKPLQGHTDGVLSVAYSPNGQHIISGSLDSTIRVWDAETGAAIGKPLEGHGGRRVRSVAYSPDGWHIISGSHDRTIQIWDTKTGTPVGKRLEGHTSAVLSVAYSPNGHHITSGSYDKTIRIWDAKTGVAVGKPLEGHDGAVWCVAYSPNGRHIITGSLDATIRIWDAKTGAAVIQPLKGHAARVLSVTYSPNGQHIISGSDDTTIRVWDAETGAVVGKPLEGHTHAVASVTYSPDGQHIISGSMGIRIWDAKTGAVVGKPLGGHTGFVRSVGYSPNGQHIISGSYDMTIGIWDAKTGAEVGKQLKGHTKAVISVAYSPNGQHIMSGSIDKTIRIWDAKSGVAVGKHLAGHTGSVKSVAYSPNGQHIISGSFDKTIRIWDAKTGVAVGKPLEGHTGSVNAVVFSPDGSRIASGSSDRSIRIWDADTGASKSLEGHTEDVESITYSPNGQHIISGSRDMTIRIWDAETGAAVGRPLRGHTGFVYSVACSPDGKHIISGSRDRTIQIWDAETGTAVSTPLKGHNRAVLSVAFSPDGRHIISGSKDGTVHVWESFPHASVPLSASAAGNPINPNLFGRPGSDGWVRDPEGCLLYWVPLDCCTGLHSPALLTIPPTSHTRSVSLDFGDFAFGTSWTEIFSSE